MNKFILPICALVLMVSLGLAQTIVSIQPTNQIAFANSINTTFSAQVDGTGPYSYQWLHEGTNFNEGIVTRIIGSSSGYSGDGGTATNAKISGPLAMALDSFGNVFIADAFNNRVRKIDASGIITTIGGTNSFGYSGDGGAAVNAKLWNPSGLALDNSGNVYIADVNNSRIRKVTTNGTISTVVGNGTNGFYGDGGQATNAEIHGSSGVPYGMCFDSLGNLYIADSLNGRIRKIDTNGVITTVAVLTYPINIAIDVPGNIFVADGSVVRKIDTNFVITTVAGGGSVLVDGGQATNAQIFPFGLAVDPTGNLFIGDITNNRRGVRKVDTNGIITTVAGIGSLGNSGDGGLATDAAFGCCYSLQFDLSGNLLIMDQLYSVVRR